MAKQKKSSKAVKQSAKRVTITSVRKRIDEVDEQILDLLNQRAGLARKIGELKGKTGKTIYVPSREEKILGRLRSQNKGPFPDESIAPVYREIISACRSLEKRVEVAYFGPEATFTHIAARQRFGHSADFLSQRNIGDVFDEVEKGRADYGVIPIENSTEGVVSHTLDMFLNSDLLICAEIVLTITHNLLSLEGDIHKVRRVYSHTQAFAQCRHWLQKNLPGMPYHEVASTAEAARMAALDKEGAAIASDYAGDYYGLKVIERGIEDQKNNFTRFLVVGKNMGPRSGYDVTSLMFSVKDEPGILYKGLQAFAERNINLSKIESRPLKGKAWEYVFFVDMDGHIEDKVIQEGVEALKSYSVFVKVLGSYPKIRKENRFLEV